MQTEPVTDIREVIAQYIMPLRAVPSTRTFNDMEAAPVHGCVAQGTCLSRGEYIHEQAAFELNDEFSRAHRKAQDYGWEGVEEVPRTWLGRRTDLGLITQDYTRPNLQQHRRRQGALKAHVAAPAARSQPELRERLREG